MERMFPAPPNETLPRPRAFIVAILVQPGRVLRWWEARCGLSVSVFRAVAPLTWQAVVHMNTPTTPSDVPMVPLPGSGTRVRKKRKVIEPRFVDVATLPDIDDIDLDSIKNFDKDQLRAYLRFYGSFVLAYCDLRCQIVMRAKLHLPMVGHII